MYLSTYCIAVIGWRICLYAGYSIFLFTFAVISSEGAVLSNHKGRAYQVNLYDTWQNIILLHSQPFMYQIPNRGSLLFSANFKPINLMMKSIQDTEVEERFRRKIRDQMNHQNNDDVRFEEARDLYNEWIYGNMG